MTAPTVIPRRPVVALIGQDRVRLAPGEVVLIMAALDRRARRFRQLADRLGEGHARVHDARRAADLSNRCAGLFRCGGEWEPRHRERREVEAALAELGRAPLPGIRELRRAIAEVVAEAPITRNGSRLHTPRATPETQAASGIAEAVPH